MFKLLDSVFSDSTQTKRSPADFSTLAVDLWETPRQLMAGCLPYLIQIVSKRVKQLGRYPKISTELICFPSFRVLTVLCWQVFQGKAFNDSAGEEAG